MKIAKLTVRFIISEMRFIKENIYFFPLDLGLFINGVQKPMNWSWIFSLLASKEITDVLCTLQAKETVRVKVNLPPDTSHMYLCIYLCMIIYIVVLVSVLLKTWLMFT